MTGKEKCAVLKTIRKDIAKANGINLSIPECTHKGECRGTCPRCEAEVKALEKALASKRKRGMKIAVAGISAGLIALNTASCDILNEISDRIHGGSQLMGDIAITEQSDGMMPPPETDAADTSDGEIEELEGDIVDLPGEVEEDAEGEK